MDNGDGMRETRAISSACMHAVCTHTDGKVMSSRLKCGALVSDWQWQLSLSDCRAHREGPRGLIDHGKLILFVAGASRFRDKFRFFVDNVQH